MNYVKCHLSCCYPDNKRLDEWVSEDRVDLDRLQLPRKESKAIGTSKNSRAASPDVAGTPPDLSRRPLTANRKRKFEHNGSEVHVHMYTSLSPWLLLPILHVGS